MMTIINVFDTATGYFFSTIRTPGRTVFFKLMTMIGNPKTAVIIFILVSIFFLYKKQKKVLVAFIITLGIAESITYVAKMVFHRARPLHGLVIETDYSFPSGHATAAMALYGFLLFYLLRKKTIPTPIKILVLVLGVALILLIGISRLYLGVHYLSDVLAGYVVGAIGLLIGTTFV